MKPIHKPLSKAFVLVALAVAGFTFCTLTSAQQSETDLEAALEAIQSTPPTPASQLPEGGTFYSAQHPFDWPPLPGNVHELPAWALGDGIFLLDDADMDYEALAELMTAAGFSIGVPLISSRSYTSNELWLEIHGVTNGCTGWTADLTIHTPEGDTNASYDLLYSPTLESPTVWQFLMRCPTNMIAQTNVYARYRCEEQGFFFLTQTNGDLTVTTNTTPQAMAERLVPPWVTVANVTYTGALAARGVFSNGYACGLPIDSGVILSSGHITNALGTNDDTGDIAAGGINKNGPSNLGEFGDDDLDDLVGDGPSADAAVLEFDIIATNSFVLQFQYVFASEEYPEFSGSQYNDPMAIFVSTNRVGTNWVIDVTNNIALLPCTASVPITVNTISGGYTNSYYGLYTAPTNAQYYADNHDPGFYQSSVPPYSVGEPVFNIEYDGMTVRLTAQTPMSANVTNHVKIGIEDYGDPVYDSAVFLKAWPPNYCP
jgi:hypothetical protein